MSTYVSMCKEGTHLCPTTITTVTITPVRVMHEGGDRLCAAGKYVTQTTHLQNLSGSPVGAHVSYRLLEVGRLEAVRHNRKNVRGREIHTHGEMGRGEGFI